MVSFFDIHHFLCQGSHEKMLQDRFSSPSPFSTPKSLMNDSQLSGVDLFLSTENLSSTQASTNLSSTVLSFVTCTSCSQNGHQNGNCTCKQQANQSVFTPSPLSTTRYVTIFYLLAEN